MTFAVLILAGGEGRRMGGLKPFRRLGGQTLLDLAIERARQWSDQVVIAVREAGQLGDIGLEVLIDAPGLEGPLAGLASAICLPQQTVLTIPCDSPFLPDDLPQRLAAALPGHGVALASSGGRFHPVCALWRIETLAQVAGYAASGRRSLIGFAREIGFATVKWPEGPFFNVNSPEDLVEAESRLR